MNGQEILSLFGVIVPVGALLYQGIRYGRFWGQMETDIKFIKEHQQNCCLMQRVETVEKEVEGHIAYHKGRENGIKEAIRT